MFNSGKVFLDMHQFYEQIFFFYVMSELIVFILTLSVSNDVDQKIV
jgi:hypothetical protein